MVEEVSHLPIWKPCIGGILRRVRLFILDDCDAIASIGLDFENSSVYLTNLGDDLFLNDVAPTNIQANKAVRIEVLAKV